MPDDRKYVRVYVSVIDDPKFASIYPNDAAIGTWLKLLMTADAVWPASVDLPRWVKPGPLKLLADAGIIDLLPGERFRVHGLDAERTRRAQAASVGGRASGRSRSVEHSLNGRSETVPDETNLAYSQDEQSKDEQNARTDAPEGEALTWLARHGCYIAPGNGYHQKLVVAVEHHGINAMVGMLDRLASAGMKDGDIKGYLFGAIDALDSQSRPSLRAVEQEDREGERRSSLSRRLEATQVRIHESGGHFDAPSAGCPRCKTEGATA